MTQLTPAECEAIDGGGLQEDLQRLVDDLLNPIKPCFPEPTRPEL